MKNNSDYLKTKMTITHAYGAEIKEFVMLNTRTKKARAIFYDWLNSTIERDVDRFLNDKIYIPGFVINKNIDLKNKKNEEELVQADDWEDYRYCTYVNKEKYPSLVKYLDPDNPRLRFFYFINLIAFLYLNANP